MRASRRRLYTASVSLVAGTIVLAALLSGMFRLAMELAPAYRQDLANWVSQTLGRPVSIARFDLSWRGFAPSLDLNGVVLFEPDTGVAALRDPAAGVRAGRADGRRTATRPYRGPRHDPGRAAR